MLSRCRHRQPLGCGPGFGPGPAESACCHFANSLLRPLQECCWNRCRTVVDERGYSVAGLRPAGAGLKAGGPFPDCCEDEWRGAVSLRCRAAMPARGRRSEPVCHAARQRDAFCGPMARVPAEAGVPSRTRRESGWGLRRARCGAPHVPVGDRRSKPVRRTAQQRNALCGPAARVPV